MAVKTRAQIQTDLDTILINTASTGSITPSVVKGILTDINDSVTNPNTDTGFNGLYAYDATRVYYNGQIIQYDYKWYVANTTTTIGAFNTAQWTFQGYISYTGSLIIETASVLTLNSTPLTLVAAIASRTFRLKNLRASLTFNSIAYATNTQLDVYMAVGGTPNVQYTIPLLLAAAGDQHRIGTITAAAQITANTALMVRVNTGNPTAGNSPITIYFEYEVV